MLTPYIIDNWFYLLLALAVLQLVWAISVLLKPILLKQKDKVKNGELPPVSVVVVAKNEKKNLEVLIPNILEQDYPDFELIVVDDQSWDGSYEYLHDVIEKHKNVELVALGDFVHSKPGKKLALTLGIKKAKNEVILLTDADCQPASKNWIKEMASSYNEETEVVLGFSPYSKKAGIINPFVIYEAFWVAWQYLGFALMGIPYMGVGRNLSYKKSTFLKNKGFANNLKVPFGDDDLLIQEIATGANTQVSLNPESFVYSNPKKGPMSWGKQKRRHLSAGKHYKFKFKFLLAFLWLSKVAYYVGAIFYFIYAVPSIVGIGLALLPLLISWVQAFSLNYKFKMFKMWFLQPVLDPIYQLILYPIFGLVATFHPQKNSW